MFKFAHIAALGCCLTLLSGCASTAYGPAYLESKAMQGKAGYATLYVFREHAEPTLFGAAIQINGKEVTTLNQGGYTWVYAQPGRNKIKAVWAGLSGQQDSYFTLNIEAGETYYVDVTGISRLAGMSNRHMYFDMGSGLNGVNPAVAEARLEKCCKFQKPVSDTY